MRAGERDFESHLDYAEYRSGSRNEDHKPICPDLGHGDLECGKRHNKQVLEGPVFPFAYDSGDANSLFDTLWTETGKTVDFVAVAGASQFTGKAVAVRPSVPANAGQVSEVSVEMDVDGSVTKAPVPAAK